MSSYTRVNWQNSPNTATPLSADNLNKMDAGIKKNADDIEQLQQHTYDAELNSTSTNAPQTKAVYEAMQRINVETDTTLSVAGKAADAAATGEAVAQVKTAISDLENAVLISKKTVQTTRITGTSIPVTTHLMDVSVSQGKAFSIKVEDPDNIIDPNSGGLKFVTVYKVNDQGTRTNLTSATIGETYEFTANENIAYFVVYKGSGVTPPGNLVATLLVSTADPENSLQHRMAVAEADISAVEADVNQIRVNTRNIFNQVWENKFYTASDGSYSNTTSPKYAATPPTLPVTGGETYAFSWGDIVYGYPVNTRFYVLQFDASGTRLDSDNATMNQHGMVLTLESATVAIGLMAYGFGASDPASWQDIVPEWVQVELGSVPTEYVPHQIVNNDLLDINHIAEEIRPETVDTVEEILPYHLESQTVKTIAHRGDDVDAPQGTAPSYIIARKHGCTIAENDLWTSEDGYLVMWHDTTLGRLGDLVDINGYLMYTDGTDYYYVNPANNAVYTWGGTDYVASSVALSSLTRCAGANYGVNSEYGGIGLDLDVLKRIDFGVYKGSQFKGTQILTFEEWVLLCKSLGMEIYVDKKLSNTDETIAEAANTVKRCGMAAHASWLGLSAVWIEKLRAIIPDARCGILAHPTAAYIQTYQPYNTGRGFFFNGDAKSGLTREAVQLGLDAGFDVEVWYVEYGNATEEQIFNDIRTAVSYGVTAMTLDHYRVDNAYAYLLDRY